MSLDIAARHVRAAAIVQEAAALALDYFRHPDALAVETKGLQDWVSQADRHVEEQIRASLAEAFPDDTIVGEEHGNVEGRSGFTWIIDPIDGTTNFVNGMPHWCVVLAGVHAGVTVVAHVTDPNVDEAFAACRGEGATRNGEPIAASRITSLAEGTIGVGHNARVATIDTVGLLQALLDQGGLFIGTGSGALDLVKVASGRTAGYCEPHMYAWDCLASLLIIEEAGGRVQPFDMSAMIESGGRVVAGCSGVYDALVAMTDAAYGTGTG